MRSSVDDSGAPQKKVAISGALSPAGERTEYPKGNSVDYVKLTIINMHLYCKKIVLQVSFRQLGIFFVLFFCKNIKF